MQKHINVGSKFVRPAGSLIPKGEVLRIRALILQDREAKAMAAKAKEEARIQQEAQDKAFQENLAKRMALLEQRQAEEQGKKAGMALEAFLKEASGFNDITKAYFQRSIEKKPLAENPVLPVEKATELLNVVKAKEWAKTMNEKKAIKKVAKKAEKQADQEYASWVEQVSKILNG